MPASTHLADSKLVASVRTAAEHAVDARLDINAGVPDDNCHRDSQTDAWQAGPGLGLLELTLQCRRQAASAYRKSSRQGSLEKGAPQLCISCAHLAYGIVLTCRVTIPHDEVCTALVRA